MLRCRNKCPCQGAESLPKGMRQSLTLGSAPCMKQTLVFLAFSAVATLLLGVVGCDKKSAPTAAAESKGAPESGARSVQVPAAQKQFLTIEAAGAAQAGDVLVLPARVAFRAQAQFAVGAPMPGRVAAVLVRAGEVVKAGAPLLAIDSADAAAGRAALDQATTRLASAENMFKRQVEMVEKGSVWKSTGRKPRRG